MSDYPALPDLIVRPIIENALAEDLGLAGDLTADLLIPAEMSSKLYFRARETGIVAGLQCAQIAFQTINPDVVFEVKLPDGSQVKKGDIIATVEGPARSLVTAERVALNFMGRLSGIATLTSKYVEAVKGTKARIAATRKTTPGLRALEKRAVISGGGYSHRYSLADAIMIKDNHIAIFGGVEATVEAAKAKADHMTVISVEVDTIEQFKRVLPLKPHVILLDNMSNDQLREAVTLNDGSVMLEASGGVTLETVGGIAKTGVDIISSGALTHSAPNFDIGLDSEQEL